MIIDFNDKRKFFRASNADTVFICSFDLLYQYQKITLKKLKDWPGVKNTLLKKKFGNNSCRMFISEKYLGKLFILSFQASEPGNEKKINEKLVNFKKWINEIELNNMEYFYQYRIDLNSLTGSYSKKVLFKFLRVLSNSEKRFKVYY